MRFTINELKAKDNEHLIALLCFLMYSKDSEDIKLQEYICKELELREVIKSAEVLYNVIK